MNKKKVYILGFTVKHFVFLIISLAIIATSLTFLVLGLIDDYANIRNSILTAPNESMKSIFGGVGFTWFGVIFTCIGSIMLAITLSVSAKVEERELEKESRRKQRLEQFKVNNPSLNNLDNSTIINNEINK